MNQIKESRLRPATHLYALSIILLLLALGVAPKTVQGQWTTGGGNTTTTDNVGIGTTAPTTKLDVAGVSKAEAISIGGASAEKTFSVMWNNSVANQKVAVYWPASTQVDGIFEVTVTGHYWYSNSNGGIRKRMVINGRGDGVLNMQQSEVPFRLGYTGSSDTISDIKWDATNKRYYFIVANLDGAQNGITIHVKSITPLATPANADNLAISPIYTTDTTVYPQLFTSIMDSNVGIGKTAPSYKLDVNGEINATGLRINGTPISAGGSTSQWTTSGGNTTTTTGNVGIGTTNPGYKLTVDAGAVSTLSTSAFTGASGTLEIWNQSVINANLRALGLGVNVPGTSTGSSTGDFLFSTYNGSAWSERVRIQNSSGNVGIGTTAPSQKLHVFGGNIFHQYSATAGQEWGFYTSINNNHFTSNLYFDGQWKIMTPGKGALISTAPLHGAAFGVTADNTARAANSPATLTTLMRVNMDGNVGIGTDSPAYKLEVNGEINASGLRINGTPVGTGGPSQWTTSASNLYYNTGNIGIGTNSPTYKLHVSGGYLGVQNSGGDAVLIAGSGAANEMLTAGWSTAGVAYLQGGTWGQTTKSLVLQGGGGNVGIGTTTPATALHVMGDITVSGNINAKYQDVAEWVGSSQKLEAGTVVALDPEKSNQVLASSEAYDVKVAGVISAQPGITLGEGGERKVLVATTGRVKVKVDATRGPIKIGDLLVTSDIRGVAMKSQPVLVGGRQMHTPGTLIGKALESLEKGTGEILVLLSLQ